MAAASFCRLSLAVEDVPASAARNLPRSARCCEAELRSRARAASPSFCFFPEPSQRFALPGERDFALLLVFLDSFQRLTLPGERDFDFIQL
ncbi:MAG: hypothetical protein VCF07_14355 [Nitrospinota bacterium]